MAWRMLFRRCPSRSMTVVGDLAQTGAAWGPARWAERSTRTPPGRWRIERADRQLPHPGRDHGRGRRRAGQPSAPGLEPPRSIREERRRPVARCGPPPTSWSARLPARGRRRGGRHRRRQAGRAGPARPRPSGWPGPSGAAVPAATVGARARPCSTPWWPSSTVAEAKGLEFDGVLVVDPAAILATGSHGANDLYVALTRATARLGVVHPGDLPRSCPAWPAGNSLGPRPGSPMMPAMPEPPDHELPDRQFGWSDMFVHPDDDPRDRRGLQGRAGHLVGFLRDQRLTLELKCAGLDAEGLARRVGAAVEPVAAGPGPPPGRGRAVLVPPAAGRASDRAAPLPRRRDPTATSTAPWPTPRSSPRPGPPGAPRSPSPSGSWPRRPTSTSSAAREGEPISLREVLVHMIEEYARHNGHADLLRERIDGRVGQCVRQGGRERPRRFRHPHG